MIGFSTAQLKKLTGKLDCRHVQTRKVDERDVNYIEGWFAIAEANAIFGFGGWDREMTHFERVFERTHGDVTNCSYMARVRVIVRAGTERIVREGTGFGSASCRSASGAHERAIKTAETDATKRALATFGNRFGLGLYDKEKTGVTAPIAKNDFVLKDNTGAEIAASLSAEAFCSGLRQVIQRLKDREQIDGCRSANANELARLRTLAPTLRTNKGEHFADILERLFIAKLRDIGLRPAENGASGAPVGHPSSTLKLTSVEADGSRIAPGPRVDKAALPIAVARRLRDKRHLRHVATLPCLVCEQVPSHAHHLTFVQPRGLSLKVSDEFVVPLCAIHHNELHRAGAEQLWWKRLGIEPIATAEELWDKHIRAKDSGAAKVA